MSPEEIWRPARTGKALADDDKLRSFELPRNKPQNGRRLVGHGKLLDQKTRSR